MACPTNQKELHHIAKQKAGVLTLPPNYSARRRLNFKREKEGHNNRTRPFCQRECKVERQFLYQPKKYGFKFVANEDEINFMQHLRNARAIRLRKLMEANTFSEAPPAQPNFGL